MYLLTCHRLVEVNHIRTGLHDFAVSETRSIGTRVEHPVLIRIVVSDHADDVFAGERIVQFVGCSVDVESISASGEVLTAPDTAVNIDNPYDVRIRWNGEPCPNLVRLSESLVDAPEVHSEAAVTGDAVPNQICDGRRRRIGSRGWCIRHG